MEDQNQEEYQSSFYDDFQESQYIPGPSMFEQLQMGLRGEVPQRIQEYHNIANPEHTRKQGQQQMPKRGRPVKPRKVIRKSQSAIHLQDEAVILNPRLDDPQLPPEPTQDTQDSTERLAAPISAPPRIPVPASFDHVPSFAPPSCNPL